MFSPTVKVACQGGRNVVGAIPTRAAELKIHENELDWLQAAQSKDATAAASSAASDSEREIRDPGQMEKRWFAWPPMLVQFELPYGAVADEGRMFR